MARTGPQHTHAEAYMHTANARAHAALRAPLTRSRMDIKKKIVKEKGAPLDAFEEEVSQALSELEANSTDLKAELRELYLVSAKEVDVAGRKAVVLFVPYRLLKLTHKIQSRLVRELEKKFSSKHVMVIAQRRIQRKEAKAGRTLKQKRPVSRTLTAVHDAILEDLVYPTEIVGKHTRYRTDGSKLLKMCARVRAHRWAQAWRARAQGHWLTRAAPPGVALASAPARCARNPFARDSAVHRGRRAARFRRPSARRAAISTRRSSRTSTTSLTRSAAFTRSLRVRRRTLSSPSSTETWARFSPTRGFRALGHSASGRGADSRLRRGCTDRARAPQKSAGRTSALALGSQNV